MKVVYMVIALRFLSEEKQRTRNWGWHETLEDAITSVVENHTDLFECGYYNYALVTAMPEGLCAIPEPQQWFKASFVETGDRAGDFISAVEVSEPEEAKGFFYT